MKELSACGAVAPCEQSEVLQPEVLCSPECGMNQLVAYTQFVDDKTRPVFEHPSGQYVIADDGEAIYGVWYIPPEECHIPLVVIDETH